MGGRKGCEQQETTQATTSKSRTAVEIPVRYCENESILCAVFLGPRKNVVINFKSGAKDMR